MPQDSNTQALRDVLRWILTRTETMDAAALLQQVDGVGVLSGPVTMLRLDVPREFPIGTGTYRPWPGRFFVLDDEEVECGELLLWVTQGRLDVLEFAWFGDEAPQALPAPQQLRFAE